MQFYDGSNIRNYFIDNLKERGIKIFDHYNNPFVNEYIKEDKNTANIIKQLVANEDWESLENYRKIRTYDLALIDKSDFIIMHYVPNVSICGSWEEFFWANRLKKPIFFIADHGKKKVPNWIFWTIPHRYIYNSREEVLNMLLNIDSGVIPIDSDRWKLLKPEYR